MNMCNLKYIGIASALFISGCDGDARPFTEAVEVRTLNIQSLEVEPPANSQTDIFLNTNEGLQFSIRAFNAAGDAIVLSSGNRAWSVSDASVATISDGGFLTALSDGSVSVSVSLGGIGSSSYALTVANATLDSINEISGSSTLERCIPADYFATGTFSDNSVRNLNNVVWALNSTAAAQLFETDGTGTKLNGINTSDTLELMASVEGVDDFSKAIVVSDNLVSMEIGPGPIPIQIDEDDELNLNVLGTYTRPTADNATATSQSIITENVEWVMETGTSNATVSNVRGSRGLLTAVDEGSASVLAQCGSEPARAEIAIDEVDADSTSSTLSFQVNNVAVGSTLVLNQQTSSTILPLRVSTGSTYDADDDITEDINFVTRFVGTAIDNPPFRIDGTGAERTIVLLGAGQGEIIATEITEGESQATLTITVE